MQAKRMGSLTTYSTRREGRVQAEVLRYLRQLPDAFVLRVQANGAGNKGVPDCVLCYRGLFIGIEFKRDLDGAYKVTKPQEIRGRQIQTAGGRWYAVDNLDSVKEILRGIDEQIQTGNIRL